MIQFGRRFRESVARGRLAAVVAEQIGTAFEFSDPLLQGHDQFPRQPIVLGHGGFLGLDLGQLPAAGGMVPLQEWMALLGREILPEQFRAIVRPPVVGRAGPIAGYGGQARHACNIDICFLVSFLYCGYRKMYG